MKKTILNKLFATSLLTGCFLAFTALTNPNDVALPLLIVPFVLAGLVCYQVVLLILALAKIKASKGLGRLILLSTVSLLVGLMLLKSLNQLTWRDSLLAAGFVGLLWLYIWRADFLRK